MDENITHELSNINVYAVAICPALPRRNPLCVITKMDAVSAAQQLLGPGLPTPRPELEPHTAEALSAFHGNHFIYVGESNHGYTDPNRVPRHHAQKIPHRGLHLHKRSLIIADIKMPYAVDQHQHQQPVHVNDVQLGAATDCS